MTQSTDTLLSSYTCVSQWHKVHWHILIILYMCVTMAQNKLSHCYHLITVCHNDSKYIDTLLSSYTCVSQWHKVQWHISIILYMCVIMTQSTDTLLSSYTCVSQWHKEHWHIVIILYLCVTITQGTMTHWYYLTPVCHNDINHIDTLLSSGTCVSQCNQVLWHIVIILYLCDTMSENTLTHYYHFIHVCHIDTKYIATLLSSYTCVSQWHKVL